MDLRAEGEIKLRAQLAEIKSSIRLLNTEVNEI